ncbi:MAG: hypothetical protein WC845_03115 [Candidatus Staskawiczbacteria bacterium]|jgi:hypothetical protein
MDEPTDVIPPDIRWGKVARAEGRIVVRFYEEHDAEVRKAVEDGLLAELDRLADEMF